MRSLIRYVSKAASAVRPGVTLITVVVVVATSLLVLEQLHDAGPANSELAALAQRLDPKTTRQQLLSLLREYPHLHSTTNQHRSGRWITVYTPKRPFADNWVAHVEFREDDTILRAYYGTVDTAPLDPRPPDMPQDRCFGSPSECSRPFGL